MSHSAAAIAIMATIPAARRSTVVKGTWVVSVRSASPDLDLLPAIDQTPATCRDRDRDANPSIPVVGN